MSLALRSAKPRGQKSRSRSFSLVPKAPASEEAGGDVDGERDDDGVEGEGDDAVGEHDAPHLGRRHVDVGGGEGAADDEGLTAKALAVGLRLVREFEAAANPALAG